MAHAETIPELYKDNALQWSQGNISETEFLHDIERLIEQNVLKQHVTSSEYSLPPWFQNNAKWWANNYVSDTDYLNSIQFLLDSNVITLRSIPNLPVQQFDAGDAEFVYHWEQDESISGYEYSASVNKPQKIDFLGSAITIPEHAFAQKLEHDYGILLSDEEYVWEQSHAYAILETMKTIPQDTRNYYQTQNIAYSKWILTDRYIEDDILVTKTDSSFTVTISSDTFDNANPKIVIIDNKQGKFFSQKLHHALVRFVTDDGNDHEAVEKILNERFGVSTIIPDYSELTAPTTAETASSFQDFHPWELVEIINMFEEMPQGFHSIPGLDYLVRRADGTPHPFYFEAPAVAWPTITPGYIEFMESAFTVNDSFLHRLILHEKAHFLWAQLFSESLQNDWSKVGGWYYDENSSNWHTTKTTEFVTEYAHAKNPDEDMAESIAYFVTNPDKLKSRSTEKYDFVRDRIMHGNVYLSQIRDDLTFEVYNLYPDYVYPGKIIRVDIAIDGKEYDDKNAKIEIELNSNNFFEGATSAYFRLFSDIGTFEDIYLSPVNGNMDSVLYGLVTLPNTAKNGFWYVEQIVVTDQTGNQRFEGQNDFGWKFFVNNPDEDVLEPKYVENTITLEKNLDNISYSKPIQVLTLNWEVDENQEMENCFARIVHEDPNSYSIDSWGKYNEINQHCVVDFTLTEYDKSGNYHVRYLMMVDRAGNVGDVDFTKNSEDPFILLLTDNEDDVVPFLDINNIGIQTTPTHPDNPNGETEVQITYFASDDKSGLGLVNFSLRDPQGIEHFEYHYHENFYTVFFDGKPQELMRYEVNILLPEGSPPGTWGLANIQLVDKANNQKTYEFTEIIHFEVE